MIIDSIVKIAVICDMCGEINTKKLNLFKLNKDKQLKLLCSCGSLNAMVNYRNFENIYLNINCVDCVDKHYYSYKTKRFIKGTDIICKETGMEIASIGNTEEINRYIERAKRKTIEELYDDKFNIFFNNHNAMKEVLKRLQWLLENGRVSCDCGGKDISTQIHSDRVELKCTKCHSIKVIYAESQDDLNNFCCKNKVSMHKYEFEFIDAIKNKE